MQVTIFSEALDRQDLLSAALECKDETREHGLAVEKNGAGAAFSQLTAVLRARMTEILAQDLEQSFIGRKGDIGLFAVQREAYLCRLLRFDRQCGHVQLPRESIIGPMRAFFRSVEETRGERDVDPSQRKGVVEHQVWPANLGSDSLQISPRFPPPLAVLPG